MSKLSAELVAFADYAMTSEDKKLSIIGVFDKVFVRTLPSNHARLSFVVTFVGEAQKEESLTLKIYTPSEKEEFTAEVKIKCGENGKFNFVSNFEGFPFKEAGQYRFAFIEKGKEVVTHTLDVVMVKEQAGQVAN